MRFEISDKTLDQISSDGVLVFVFQKEKNKKFELVPTESFNALNEFLDEQLSLACEIERFEAKKGEVISIIPAKKILPSRVFAVGLGKKEEFTVDVLRRAIGRFTKTMKKKIDSVTFEFPDDLAMELSVLAGAVSEGFLLGRYEFNKYKEKRNERDFSLVIFSVRKDNDKKVIYNAVKKSELYSNATILARDLVNEQAAVATPEFLAKIAMDIARKNPKQITCKVFEKADFEKMGMGAFLMISNAAGDEIPPKFIHLEYRPASATSTKKLALVGKGITFDSGGINVKPGDHMIDMKMDMAGAAAVIGVFSVISEIKPDFTVIGLIAATPNLISAKSALPGDVAKAMNGKTIEILDTDAEGRVTLADSLSYAVKEGATEIVDLATLTGAVLIALGSNIGALFSNNRDLAGKIKSAAFSEGEKVWELPLEEDYREYNKSEVADIANIPNTRYGGTITAALFLEEFVGNKAWAHLDIAGAAYLEKGSDICTKGGTGFGVRTLLKLIEK